MRFLVKLGINLPCDQAIPLPGIHPEKATVIKDTCTLVFIAALFTIARTWKQPRCPSTDELIKMWYVYTMEYYSPIKKSKFEPFHLVSALSLVLRPHACIPPWKQGAYFSSSQEAVQSDFSHDRLFHQSPKHSNHCKCTACLGTWGHHSHI